MTHGAALVEGDRWEVEALKQILIGNTLAHSVFKENHLDIQKIKQDLWTSTVSSLRLLPRSASSPCLGSSAWDFSLLCLRDPSPQSTGSFWTWSAPTDRTDCRRQVRVWLSAQSAKFPRPSCLSCYLVLVRVRQGLGRLREVRELYKEAQSVSLAVAWRVMFPDGLVKLCALLAPPRVAELVIAQRCL